MFASGDGTMGVQTIELDGDMDMLKDILPNGVPGMDEDGQSRKSGSAPSVMRIHRTVQSR
jgi:hypothetical protein